jgi:hypothetical protein
LARKVYYRPDGTLFDVMLGVNITHELNSSIERAADVAHRTKSDFIRLVLEKGLKSVQDERLRKRGSA